MLAFCLTCWNEITNSPTVCRKCGTIVNIDSPEYGTQLLDLLSACGSTRRVEICLLLGRQKRRTAVAQLASIADKDPEGIVRIAALRALGDIGDDPAMDEIENVALSNSPVASTAKEILMTLRARVTRNH